MKGFSPNVKVVELGSMEEARQRAEGASGAIGGITFPVAIFKQGRRYMLSGALTVPYIAANLVAEAVEHKSSVAQVQAARNRPVFPEHVQEIKSYLEENATETFILPPLTLNVRDPITLYTFREGDDEPTRPVKAGFVVLARETLIDIADGQHRQRGVKQAYENSRGEERTILANSAVAVMITCETEVEAIHQDFADCSKTKPINPSQLAVYDRRNPANALVLGLAERCDLFRDKLDTTSSKLGKTSPYPFITNQVRQVVKVFLTGSNADADEVFEAKAKKILGSGTSPAVKERVETVAEYMNRATAAIPEYRAIAEMGPGEELKAKLVKWRTTGFVSLTGTGLVAIARVLYELKQSGEPEWQKYVDRMAKIDWRKTGRWPPRVVTPDHAKVNSGYAASMAAAAQIKELIGWKRDAELFDAADGATEPQPDSVAA